MSIRNKYLFPISLLFFLAFQLFLVNNRLYEIGILFYLVYTTFLFAINKNYVITFFVFYLPIAPMVSAFHKLFGILGPHEIIYGFACYVLFNIANARNIKLNKYQKLAIKFVYFVFFINIYIISKDIIMGLDPDRSKGVVYIFKNFVRYFLYYYSLVLLIKVIYTKGILNYIIEGIKYSVLVLVLSMLFTPELVKMGVEIFVSSAKQFKDTRFMGLYKAGGDFNSTGVFLVAVFGFFLALFEKTGGIINYIVFMGAAVLGILLTGSRTSFLALVSVILIFMIANKSGSAKFYILVAFIIFYLVFFQQLEIIILRFLDPSAVGAVDPESDGRVYKWIFYSNWIINNPETLLFGNQELINIPHQRAPHNYFLYVVYHTGILPLIIFMNLFVKLLKITSFKLRKYELRNIYYILPFPFVLMTVNSFGSAIYLWIFLPIGASFFIKKSLVNEKFI